MSRFRPSLSSILIVLPYILLSAAIWLEFGSVGGLSSLFWQVDYRWPLRALNLGVTFLGWRAGRPSWFYSWLGFAVWESVFMLLDLSAWLPGALDGGSGEVVARQLSNGLPFLALTLYLLVPLWAGWRRPRSLLGACTVFPHAALSVPLIWFAQRLPLPTLLLVDIVVLSAGVSAVAALLFWRPPAFLVRAGVAVARCVVLYLGVLLAQSTLWVTMGLIVERDGFSYTPVLKESTILGWMLLSGAMLLPFLARALISLGKLSLGRVHRVATPGRPPFNDNRNCQDRDRDESGTE